MIAVQVNADKMEQRLEHDFYPTPLYSLIPLLERVNLSNITSFLEPCRGDSRIFDLIDCKEKYWAEIREGGGLFIHSFFKY